MGRLFNILLFALFSAVAAAIGSMMVARALLPATADMSVVGAAGVVGMFLGLLFASVRRIPWQRMFAFLQRCRMRIAKQSGWALLACMSVAVLFLY